MPWTALDLQSSHPKHLSGFQIPSVVTKSKYNETSTTVSTHIRPRYCRTRQSQQPNEHTIRSTLGNCLSVLMSYFDGSAVQATLRKLPHILSDYCTKFPVNMNHHPV